MQVGESFLAPFRESHRGGGFGVVFANCGPLGDGKRGNAFAKELDKLADDLRFAQHFCDAQEKINRPGLVRKQGAVYSKIKKSY